MRRPRGGFSVGMLLFAVALAAANCKYVGPLVEQEVYTGGTLLGHRVPSLYIGFVPLANFAAIGTWQVVAGGLRSLRRGRAGGTRSPWPGWTYFSVGFLAILGLVHEFVPDAVDHCRDRLDKVLDWAASGWYAAFGEPGGTYAWMAFACLLYGLVLSGPVLAATLVGQRIAGRCADRLPRARFRAMVSLVTLDFVFAALAIALTMRPIYDERDVGLGFRIVDETSRRPVAGAFVCLTDPFSDEWSPQSPRDFTDRGGQARLTGRFRIVGEGNAFTTMAWFSPWGRWLEVSADGYRTRRVSLADLVEPAADPVQPRVRTVKLSRGETPAGPFRDLAGLYATAGNGFAGYWIQIEPDGRFAWCEWGCTGRRPECGYLKRHGPELELVPIHHTGWDDVYAPPARFRAIAWGGRRYLCVAEEEELREFCRNAVAPGRTSTIYVRYGSFLHSSDVDKPVVGLPRLPAKVWASYLVGELSRHYEQGTLRMMADSLVRQVHPRTLAAAGVGPK